MTKIVINGCYGGFGLSKKAQKMLGVDSAYAFDFDRTDERLIKVVEELKEDANGPYADLKIVEIPDDSTLFYVDDYDGLETVVYERNGKTYYEE